MSKLQVYNVEVQLFFMPYPSVFMRGHSNFRCLGKHPLQCGVNLSFLCRDNGTGKGLNVILLRTVLGHLGKPNKFFVFFFGFSLR